ncbi:MAG: helix-turn-helix domain-containing protein [Microthrixaceae bacterium]|jgi:hypothetical protein|nr:helix-turn-helix domain-containing protein [Microthrixaceae bacterium]
MSTITIVRNLVTISSEWDDAAGEIVREYAVDYRGTELWDSAFTLTRNDDDTVWIVSDGCEAVETEDAVEALRTYAEFIETFVDNLYDDATAQAVWQAEIDRALADAESLRMATKVGAEAELREAARAGRAASERVRALAIAAVKAGASEVRAAELAGVSRPTLRKWLGK